jgi:hypothetical protein
MISELTLSEWVKEAQHRKETVKVYLANHTTQEVVAVSINPNFIAGIVKTAVLTNYRLTT